MSSESVRRRPEKPSVVRVKLPICAMWKSFLLVVCEMVERQRVRRAIRSGRRLSSSVQTGARGR